MRRFETVLKHLVSAQAELYTLDLWDPVLFPESIDEDWSDVASVIDALILACRQRCSGSSVTLLVVDSDGWQANQIEKEKAP